MKYRWGICIAAVTLLSAALGQDNEQKKKEPPTVEIDDPVVAEVLEKINSVSAYEVPDLGLRKDVNYAQTPVDVEPFREVTPFKEHFLLQMEYTGPGRAKPEPVNLDSVKLGFIGPIMSTVSVATGGKIKMFGTNGTNFLQLYGDTTANAVPSIIQTALDPMTDPIRTKQALKVGIEATISNGAFLYVTIDSETGSSPQYELGNFVQWLNNFGNPIPWTNNSSAIIQWFGGQGYVLSGER